MKFTFKLLQYHTWGYLEHFILTDDPVLNARIERPGRLSSAIRHDRHLDGVDVANSSIF